MLERKLTLMNARSGWRSPAEMNRPYARLGIAEWASPDDGREEGRPHIESPDFGQRRERVGLPIAG
jgi:hypothetical protein